MRGEALIPLLAVALAIGCAAPVKPPASKPVPPVARPAPALSVPAPRTPPQAAAPPASPGPPPAPVAPKTAALVRLPAERLPEFTDDMDAASLETAISRSLQYLGRAAGNGTYRFADRIVTVQELRESLLALREILRRSEPPETRQAMIRETFEVYQSTGLDSRNTVLFTGYFEALLNGSLRKTEKYRYPLYRAPKDAVAVNLSRFGERFAGERLVGRLKDGELVPYYTRNEIDGLGALAGRNLELAWVDDPIALFFLHVQGSGKLRLPDGKLLQVGFALNNGYPYQSIGRYLLDTGRVAQTQVSHQAIKRYLRDHPEAVAEILGHNESYVFFREVGEGPVGAIGEILTAGRSIATDAAIFPKGALAFMKARKPILDRNGDAEGWVPFSRFVVSQDTGSAIKGAGRVDLFCGSGDDAELLAGSLAERGELYFLVKKRP